MKIKAKGISTLVLIFIIASLLAMITFVLHPISLLAARRANQFRYSQTAFFAAEGALYETIQHLRDNEDPNWPDFSGVDGEDIFNYTIGEGDGETKIRRVITQTDDGVAIDITATIKGRKRRVAATFSRSTGGRTPLDIMLVIDRSTSMAGNPIAQAKNAALSFVDKIQGESADDRIGLVSYSNNATKDQELTEIFNDVKIAIGNLDAGGSTNIGEGIYKAIVELDEKIRKEATEVIIVLSDGVANKGCGGCPTWPCLNPDSGYEPDDSGSCCTDYAVSQANIAKFEPEENPRNYIIFSILLNNIPASECSEDLGRLTLLRVSNEPSTRPLPSEDEEPYTYYKETDDESELENIYSEIAGIITSPELFRYQEEIPEPE